MPYYEDELAPPSGDLTSTLLRAAGVSACILVMSSDQKPKEASSLAIVTLEYAPQPPKSTPAPEIAVVSLLPEKAVTPQVTDKHKKKRKHRTVLATHIEQAIPTIAEQNTLTLLPAHDTFENNLTIESIALTTHVETSPPLEKSKPEPERDARDASAQLTASITPEFIEQFADSAEHVNVQNIPTAVEPEPVVSNASATVISPTLQKENDASDNDKAPSISNRDIIHALAIAISTANTETDSTTHHSDVINITIKGTPEANTGDTETSHLPAPTENLNSPENDDAEWEARMRTSQLHQSNNMPTPRKPKNLTAPGFADNDASDATGRTLTLNLAALGDAPIAAFFISETVGKAPPRAPKSDSNGWRNIVPANAYGAEEKYALQKDYADNTDVSVHVWFKDSLGKVSPAAHSKVKIHRPASENIAVSLEHPYVADTAIGFKGWTYRRGANQIGDAPLGRFPTPADADNYFVSPAVKLPNTEFNTEIVMQLRQWYSFAQRTGVSDGARTHVQIAAELSPGQWSDWESIDDDDNSLSTLWTSPRLSLTSYAGAIVKIRVGIDGNLRRLENWGLSDFTIALEQPVTLSPHTEYTQSFENDWGQWHSRLPQWSIDGPRFDGSSVANDGLYFASAQPIDQTANDSALYSPIFQLPEGTTTASLAEWHVMESGSGVLQLSYFDTNKGWQDWRDISGSIIGQSTGWQILSADLSPYSGMRIRLRFNAHLQPNDTAWRIDNFTLKSSP